MIERYEKEMRKIFDSAPRITEPAVETAVRPEDAPQTPQFQQRQQGGEELEPPMRPESPQEPAPPERPMPLPELQEPVPSQQQVLPEGIGTITVEVTTGRGAVPLSGVDVVIDRLDVSDPKGRQELIAVRTTGRDGRTVPVAVATVSRELSLTPGNASPFSTFYVSASAKGYEPVKSMPVDVFANEASILKIDLVPKPEDLTGGEGDG